MAGGFEDLENVTADLGIRAWGQSLEEAIANMAAALFSLISDTSFLSGEKSKTISVNADDTPGLLVNFLNNIIFLEDTEGFLPKSMKISNLDPTELTAVTTGDIFDPSRHFVKNQVKAATYHGLRVDRTPEGYKIEVIFDV